MRSDEVRQVFLEFFAGKGHQKVPSSPLVLPADPTLLFANAGMNQFKEVFRGRETRPYLRATSVQKCMRVSGKHNDLEEVGKTPRHHTFFEMLGNFSFGDYFKKEACLWAWELLTEVYGIDSERLVVTVFAGDDDFAADEEAARIWREDVGVEADRISALGRRDNFWQMGETGPAGPCSEIHYDMAPDAGPTSDPGEDPERYLEIWNLVFMQYDLQPDGGAVDLPAPCVDTGAGLERLVAVMGGFESNYQTDLFQPLILPLAEEAGFVYGEGNARDVSLRVISDHLRAITMLVADGVIPGPEKRGAVLRRILRRALRHGRLAGLPAPFLHRQIGNVVALLGETYAELREVQPTIETVVRNEEQRFEQTLAAGFEKLEEAIESVMAAGGETFPGEEAFVLESERGLPLDLVRDALEERGLVLDEPGYLSARKKHVERSRVWKAGATPEVSVDLYVPWQKSGSHFVGRDRERVDAARVLGILSDGVSCEVAEQGSEAEVILDETPFYAESGGQIGDRGLLIGASFRASVLSTRSPVEGVIVHRVLVDQGVLESGQIVVAEVDHAKRLGAARHHTATHLLHAGLRTVLGPHVRQSGSLVAFDRLRFDFSHFSGLSRSALDEIEDFVNEAVRTDFAVETEEMPLEQALASGAIAFFGDRYGETVRVVRIGDVSVELCGGIHTGRTGEIGLLWLLAEKGIAAGVRRVEAVTGPDALQVLRSERDVLSEISTLLGTSRTEVRSGVARRIESLDKARKEMERLRLEQAQATGQTEESRQDVRGITVIARRADGLNKGQRRDLADGLRGKEPSSVIVLCADDGGKASLLVAVGEEARAKVDARDVVRKLGPLVAGGGGGRPDLAEAGGKKPSGLPTVIADAAGVVEQLLEAR